jgi:xanthine dehydrogenase YagR molybdenum-binding subunit
VIAETFEQATAAAALIRVRYESSPGQYDLRAAEPNAEDPGHISDGSPADSAVGDFEAAFAAAPVKIEAI